MMAETDLIAAGIAAAKRLVPLPEGLSLAPSHAGDSETLLAIERVAFPWLEPLSGFARAAFDCGRPFATVMGPLLRITARSDGPIVGYVFAQPRADELFVWDMAHCAGVTGPGCMGFGSILMLAAVGLAEVAGVPLLRFDVTRHDGRQAAAVRLCRRHGLKLDANHGLLLRGQSPQPDSLIMTASRVTVAARLRKMEGLVNGQRR